MSLPARPWPDAKIGRLYNKSNAMMARAIRPYNRRLMKRADRVANRSFALWFQAKDIDPHAPASLTEVGYGTRKHRP